MSLGQPAVLLRDGFVELGVDGVGPNRLQVSLDGLADLFRSLAELRMGVWSRPIPRQEAELGGAARRILLLHGRTVGRNGPKKEREMSKEEDNKAVVVRWFTDFWGENCDLSVVDEVAAPNMLLQYSLHEPRRGREDIKAFMTDFRVAFPDLNFWATADLIAEGDYVVGQWEGGGTHTGPAFEDFLVGTLPANSGRKMHFTGTTVLKVVDGQIVEELGLDDGVAAMTQLGLLKAA
jgi:predicted ester cyclase